MMAENRMKWAAHRYTVAVTIAGKRDDLLVEGVAGGFFGIDERANLENPRSKAWAVIHLPTGYAAAFVRGPIANAKRVAAALNAAADWGFSGTNRVNPTVAKAARDVLASHTKLLIDPDKVGPAKMAFVYPEEATP